MDNPRSGRSAGWEHFSTRLDTRLTKKVRPNTENWNAFSIQLRRNALGINGHAQPVLSGALSKAEDGPEEDRHGSVEFAPGSRQSP
jgi:hypothetical protein